MIVTQDRHWLRLIFFSVRGSTLQQIWTRVLLVTLLAWGVTYVELHMEFSFPSLTPLPFQLIALALGIFLGFRNSECYQRFWEGRKLWGSVVNLSRNVTRQVDTYLVVPAGRAPEEQQALVALRKRLVYRVLAYVHALRHHLRGTDPLPQLERFLEPRELEALGRHTNKPLALAHGFGPMLREALDRGWIDPLHLPRLDASISSLVDAQGGCERIKSTPVPFQYTVLTHRIVAAYCFALPFGIVATVGAATPLVALFIAYTFFGLDTIGGELEDPFGVDPNDLPLQAITRTIEVNLRQILEEEDVPELLMPQGRLLL